MKPVRLVMQAFGSYLERTEIDFTKFYSSGIFLICGQTGGGKTTVLDAMSVALYGDATGSLRQKDKWQIFRCRKAPAALDTEIEFEFDAPGGRYKFYRRWRARKSGLADVENCCYVQKDGEWQVEESGRSGAVSKAAERILGLNHDQFVKVICLPQGEFRELLTSSSSTRSEIFERLFGTGRWKQIINAASSMAESARRELEDMRAEQSALLQAAGCASQSELASAIEDNEKRKNELETQAEEISSRLDAVNIRLADAAALEEQFLSLAAAKERLDRLSEQQEETEKLSARLERNETLVRLMPGYNALSEAKNALSQADTACRAAQDEAARSDALLKEISTEMEKLPQVKNEIEALCGEIPAMESMTGRARELAEAQTRVLELEHAAEDAEAKKEEFSKRMADAQARCEKGRGLLDECDGKLSSLPEVTARHTRLSELCNGLRAASQTRQQAEQAESEIASAKRRYLEEEDRFNKAKKYLDRLETARRMDTAYALACELEDLKPCPVCGAVHHPQPAAPLGEAPDEQELAEAGQSAETARTRADSAKTDLEKTVSRYELLCAQARQLRNNLGDSRPDEQIIKEFEENKTLYDRLGEQLELRGKYAARLNELETGLAQTRQQAERLERELTENSLRLDSLRQTVTRLLGEIPEKFRYADRLETTISEKKTRLGELRGWENRVTEDYGNIRIQAEKAAVGLSSAKSAAETAAERLARLSAEYEQSCAAAGVDPKLSIETLILKNDEAKSMARQVESFKSELLAARLYEERLETELSGKKRPELDAVKAEAASVLERFNEISRALGEVSLLRSTLSGAAEKLSRLSERGAAASDNYGRLTRLKEFICGRNQKKTPLDQFVVGLLLDEVIAAANGYFSTLSRGQYALRRAEEASGMEHYQGVNFEVVDTHIGGVRQLSTLSGGEMFLASLSLAFGLTDVVQSFSGGMKLESLFIDEGFGSLDKETLNLAVKAISEVRAGRIIGIISHVDELRERIGSRIEINKDDKGSHLKIMQ